MRRAVLCDVHSHLEGDLDYFEDRNIQATRLSCGSSGGFRINVYGNFCLPAS